MIVLLKQQERNSIKKKIEDLVTMIEEGSKSARICCSIFLKKQNRTIRIRNGLLETVKGKVYLFVNEGPYKGTYAGRTLVSSAEPIRD
ncbi:MAG: hypothetical protein U9N04_00460 [Patescibacteria group bacterium]|nr:hypothetical protein [Patescibacteria group bacterium]